MKKLDHAGLLELRERFGNLHDACIESVEISFSSPIWVRWTLRALDFPPDFTEWGNGPQPKSRKLYLELRDVEAFCAKRLPNFDWVVIHEACIDFVGDQVYVDFDYESNEHEFVAERFNDPDNWSWLESSERYSLATELWWKVEDFDI